MPFCPQCGVDNPASARYCDQCGAELIAVPGQAMPTPAPTPAPVVAGTAGGVSAGPSACPQCGSAVIPGEAFCDNCGASLLAGSAPVAGGPVAPGLPFTGAPPQPTYPAPQPVAPPVAQPVAPPPVAQPQPQPYTPPPVAQPQPQPYTPPVAQPVAPPARTTLAPARLVIIANSTALPLPAAGQAFIGRADPVSNFFPEIDLTAHGALDQGTGRRHARIFVQNGQVYVEDLDSTNGTFLNGQRLAPRSPQLVRGGEELRLGNMPLRIEL